MATMDIIQLHGGSPANFLDVGGKVQAEQVEKAFNILTQDPAVKAIFVNIFGGIVDCRVIATGIISACTKSKLVLPLVVRLKGSNVEAARELLEGSGLDIMTYDMMDDAAAAVVKCTMK
jgi:succinyl-CoA synthetase beta subunit